MDSFAKLGNLVSQSMISLFKVCNSVFSDMKCLLQLSILCSASNKLGGKIGHCQVEVVHIICESGIARFQMGTSLFTCCEGGLGGVQVYTASVEFTSKVGKCGIEVGILIT